MPTALYDFVFISSMFDISKKKMNSIIFIIHSRHYIIFTITTKLRNSYMDVLGISRLLLWLLEIFLQIFIFARTSTSCRAACGYHAHIIEPLHATVAGNSRYRVSYMHGTYDAWPLHPNVFGLDLHCPGMIVIPRSRAIDVGLPPMMSGIFAPCTSLYTMAKVSSLSSVIFSMVSVETTL